MAHIGSWGTPDFGFTEWIADKFFGGSKTGQWGSDIFPNIPKDNQPYNDPRINSILYNPNDSSTPSTSFAGPGSGSVLGTNTGSGGGGGTVTQQPVNNGSYTFNINDFPNYAGWDPNAAEQDWIAKGRPTGGSGGSGGGGIDLNAQLRNEIESGYNDYISNLESMYGGLDSQAQAQRDIAQRSYDQSIKDLGLNKESSLQDLGVSQGKVEANQVKNLRDIADNIRNQYMAGNVMLGARGAGDSSAANQYSYALNRVGSRERGNVMNQTASSLADLDLQRAKLNNIVTQETSRLDTELGNSLSQITSWLAEQQNSIKNMIAQGKLNKSQDIASLTRDRLNQAVAAYQEKQRDIASKKAALESWAMTNADNISKLATNMKSIGQFVPNMPYANPLNGSVSVDSQGNIRGMYGYGANKDEEHPYFRY